MPKAKAKRAAPTSEKEQLGRALLLAVGALRSPESVEREARELLAQGADPNARDAKDGMTALMSASRVGHPGVVRLLLAAGADVHARSEAGDTALLWAACEHGGECARALLAAGADVDARGSGGSTPAMTAGLLGRAAPLALLVEAGADLLAVDDHGETAMDWAAKGSSSEKEACVAILRSGVEAQHLRASLGPAPKAGGALRV